MPITPPKRRTASILPIPARTSYWEHRPRMRVTTLSPLWTSGSHWPFVLVGRWHYRREHCWHPSVMSRHDCVRVRVAIDGVSGHVGPLYSRRFPSSGAKTGLNWPERIIKVACYYVNLLLSVLSSGTITQIYQGDCLVDIIWG